MWLTLKAMRREREERRGEEREALPGAWTTLLPTHSNSHRLQVHGKLKLFVQLQDETSKVNTVNVATLLAYHTQNKSSFAESHLNRYSTVVLLVYFRANVILR